MRCLHWKIIAAVVAIGIGVYALAPGVAAGAVPLLVLAVCPLSMLLMIRAMGSMEVARASARRVTVTR